MLAGRPAAAAAGDQPGRASDGLDPSRATAAGSPITPAPSATASPTSGSSPESPTHTPLGHNRDFTLLWSGQAISDLGSQMSVICYPLLVLAATGSAGKAGFVGGAQLVATLFTLLPAGVVADRYPRKRILVITSLIQMAAVGSVVPFVLTHHIHLPHLMAVGAIQGSASAFYIGASRGALRRIVTSAQLPSATALTQARGQAATMAGPPIGGALFGLARALPFGFDSISFGAIAIAAGLMRSSLDPVRDPAAVREPMRRAVGRGLRFVFAEPFLRVFALWAAAVNSIAAGMMLMVIVFARVRGANPPEVGALLSASALCGLAGSLFGPRLAARLGSRTWVMITSWLLPTCAVGIAFAPWVWLIAVLGAVTTFTIMPVNVVFLVRAARITPDDLQAQASNARQLVGSSLSWLAPPTFGFLIDTLGPRTAILIAAALYGVTAIWLQFNREMFKLDDKDAPDGYA
jgi:MFS family permease